MFPLLSDVPRRTVDLLPATFDGVGPTVALAWLRQGLRTDPNAAPLLFWGIVQLLRDGDVVQAQEWLERLQALAPEWALTRYAEQLLKETAP